MAQAKLKSIKQDGGFPGDDDTFINHYIVELEEAEGCDGDKTLSADMYHAKKPEEFGYDVGDTIVLLGQGYHGVTAASLFPVKGILHLPIPDLNSQMVLMPLNECQYFYASENRLTSLSFMLKDPEKLEETVEEISLTLDEFPFS